MFKRHKIIMILAVTAVFSILGCQRTYYSFWEKLGKEKRHLLGDQIKKVSAEQEEATEQFQDTLSQIKALYGYEGGEIEKVYENLKDDYERSRESYHEIQERIGNVSEIANDLFDEWEAELDEIQNKKLRSQSRQSLNSTKARFARVYSAMKKAEASMEPVITNLNDYVLYLKHNLNAQAIGALRGEADNIAIDIRKLIEDMNASIREAEAFIQDLN